MILTWLLYLIMISLVVSVVVMLIEGFKISVATIGAFFALTWATVVEIWGSFTQLVLQPGYETLLGVRELTIFNIGATFLAIVWTLICAMAMFNFLTSVSRGKPTLVQ